MADDEHTPSASLSVVPASDADALSIKDAAFVASYVQHGNAARSYREAFDTSGMLPATIKRKAFDVLHSGPVSRRVAELRKAAGEALGTNLGALVLDCYEMATTSPDELMPVDVHACRVCASTDGKHPAWSDVEEFSDACEAWSASLNGPKPLRKPSAAGGFAYDPFAPVNPTCKGCHGRGLSTVRILPSSEWSAIARRMYAGAVVDDEGRVLKLLFEDKSKYVDMLHKLLGLYTVKTESKSLNVNYNLTAPTTAQPPMSAEDALAKLRALGLLSTDDATVVSDQ